MKAIGMLTTAIGVTMAVIAAVVAVRSAPDIRRYLKIRAM
jgi:hypothetical protein